MVQSLYEMAVEAQRTHALRSCEEGYELSVVTEHFWDGTAEKLTIHYNRSYQPLCYTLTHFRPQEVILTGTSAQLGAGEEVYGRTHHVFH